jgi:CBS domain-containing protein
VELREMMTPNPTVLSANTMVADAAELMRDQQIGDVLVERDGQLAGIVTDRDIVTRAVAAHRNPSEVSLGEICTSNVQCVSIETSVEDVIRLMSERSVRRIPVVDSGNKPLGIVALGDLAVERDRQSLLGDISAAAPNS